jgi:hypothetical protein
VRSAADPGVFEALEEAPRQELRVLHQVGGTLRRTGRHTCRLQPLGEREGILRPCPLGDAGLERVFVRFARGDVGEARVRGERRVDLVREGAPFAVARAGDREPRILARAGEDAVWGHPRVAVALARRLRAVEREVH